MRIKRASWACATCLVTGLVATSEPPGARAEPAVEVSPGQILARSIAYHDPNGVWGRARVHLDVHTTYSEAFAKRAGSHEAKLAIVLAPGHDEFSYVKRTSTDTIEIAVRSGTGTLRVNGSTDVSEDDKQRLRLGEATMYRDYCEYLYGMPMKLKDPGTILDSSATRKRFNDRDALQVRVTYDPEVGQDIWYFYFDPESFALIGYRFYHDESKNDGEYITFEGEIVDEASGLRLPKARAWYYNADHGHLATDDIVAARTS